MQVILIKNNKFWIEPETEFESQFLALNFEGQVIKGFLKTSGEKIQGLVIEAVSNEQSAEDNAIATMFEEQDGFFRKEYVEKSYKSIDTIKPLNLPDDE